MNLHVGVSELMKGSVGGWFKLLAQEEGEFYSVPVPTEEGSKFPIKPAANTVRNICFLIINHSISLRNQLRLENYHFVQMFPIVILLKQQSCVRASKFKLFV